MNYYGIRPTRLYGAGGGAITTSTTVPTVLIKPPGAQGISLYIVTNPMLVQFCPAITAVYKTMDSGATFTDLTSALIDADPNTGASLNALSTLVAGDALFVGIDKDASGLTTSYIGARGLYVDITTANSEAATVAAAFNIIAAPSVVQAEAGGSWTGFTETDNTLSAGATLATTARTITWSNDPTTWINGAINGHTAYWVRLAFSATLSATVTLSGMAALSRYWTQNSITMAAQIAASTKYELMFDARKVGAIELLAVTGAGTAYVNWLI